MCICGNTMLSPIDVREKKIGGRREKRERGDGRRKRETEYEKD